jgi:hypothetical protein
MTERATVTAVALVLGLSGTLALADQAKPRGSSSGSSRPSSGRSESGRSHSGSVGSRQHSPSQGNASAPRASSSGHGYRGGSRSDLTIAERRHPRAGTGTGYYRPYSYYPGYGYWYSPGYYPGYYYGYWPYWGGGLAFGVGSYYGGHYGGYGYGGGYGSPYVYRSYHQSDAGALRILVDPEDTKVYVDGYYAGEVDDFDGLWQRLYVSPGRHEVLLKKDGYRTHRFKVYVGEDSTVKLRHEMERGSGPDTMEDLAGERGLYEERRREARDDEDFPAEDAGRARPRENEKEAARPEGAPPPPLDGSQSAGLLALDVSPNDASVYVDGRFVGSVRQTGELELSPGPHRIEVVRPGYETAEREVVIEAGRTSRLFVSLRRP